MQKIKRVFKYIYEHYIIPFAECIKDNGVKLSELFIFAAPIVVYNAFIDDKNTFFVCSIIHIIFHLVKLGFKILNNMDDEQETLPVCKKRFTKVERDTGRISVKREDWPEAISYLCCMEDYIEQQHIAPWK